MKVLLIYRCKHCGAEFNRHQMSTDKPDDLLADHLRMLQLGSDSPHYQPSRVLSVTEVHLCSKVARGIGELVGLLIR